MFSCACRLPSCEKSRRGQGRRGRSEETDGSFAYHGSQGFDRWIRRGALCRCAEGLPEILRGILESVQVRTGPHRGTRDTKPPIITRPSHSHQGPQSLTSMWHHLKSFSRTCNQKIIHRSPPPPTRTIMLPVIIHSCSPDDASDTPHTTSHVQLRIPIETPETPRVPQHPACIPLSGSRRSPRYPRGPLRTHAWKPPGLGPPGLQTRSCPLSCGLSAPPSRAGRLVGREARHFGRTRNRSEQQPARRSRSPQTSTTGSAEVAKFDTGSRRASISLWLAVEADPIPSPILPVDAISHGASHGETGRPSPPLRSSNCQ